ncbi:acVLRF1 family peptidyl-tRNA hydrolase [Cryptosporangium aurantiacum]|uniref:Actinobacteria/chloroflexi VLRF1 release factor domain-containing protein n=1 Tax=Cryptosporangium aurantiacum TaxID=134849 RepID=A0A1M7J922_9ACTN|nr:acVLRF1 family peptidyl-tRNA hydrolase [Cryptosporangium aurantiacum]SHM49007.1 hypothetical protein SAMN05443668_101711 [Cryptosporangium aurantiacum]
MTKGKPAAGGGRWVEVPPERLQRWFAGFAERHGAVRAEASAGIVTLVGADEAVAECHVPFPPLPAEERDPAEAPDPAEGRDPLDALIAHACRDRRVGVLLVRLGGYAAGVFEGVRLVTSKVDTRQVHGRNKAGGWSQQRFARRREGQARQLTDAAAATAARILLPEVTTLDAVVLGGDRTAVDATLATPALAPLRERAVERFLTVPDPRRDVLEATPAAFRAVRIRLTP